MRGECKYEGIICCPQFYSRISDAEMRVMKMIYEGANNEDIAEKLYLSPHTVKIILSQCISNLVFMKIRVYSIRAQEQPF